MNTYVMAQGCHTHINHSPDIEGLAVDLDITNDSENVDNPKNLLTAQKLRVQERVLRSLRDQTNQVEKEGYVENKKSDPRCAKEPGVCDSETLLDGIERNSVCLHTSVAKEDAKMSELHIKNDNLIKETISLKRKVSNQNILISQLRFRYKLLEDTLICRKNTKLSSVLYEKAFLKEESTFLQEENLKKDEELSKAKLELKKAQEWKVDMTDNCILDATLTDHEQEIRNFQETIKHERFLKNEIEKALDKSQQNEVQLAETLLQLQNENKEQKNGISIMTHRLNKCIELIHNKEEEIKNERYLWQRQIEQLKVQLEENNQEVIKRKEQARIAQEKMCVEKVSFKDEIAEQETQLQSVGSEVKLSIEIHKAKEAHLHSIISKQRTEIKHLQTEFKTRLINDTVQTQLRKSVKELEQSKCEIEYEREKAFTTQKQMNKIFEENEHLKIEMLRKDRELQELKKENEAKVGVVNKANRQIIYFKEQLKESCDEIASLRRDYNNVRYSNQHKDDQISELKNETERNIKTLQGIESEMAKANYSLQRQLNAAENDLETCKQELKREKYQSNIEMTKLRFEITCCKLKIKEKESEMETRIHDLINKLKTKEEEQQKRDEKLCDINDSQKQQIQHLEMGGQTREREMKFVEIEKNNDMQEIENNIVELRYQMKRMLSILRDTDAELGETKSRLSRVMEDNSPNITDLSDRNRPTKIAEKCAELYKNEWKYAFDVLEKLFGTEEAAIETSLLILQNAMHFCKTMALRQIENIEREMYFADENERIAISSYIQTIIEDRRKTMATGVVGNLKKIYVAQLKQSKDEIMRAALDVEPYTSECIEICWFMLIQDPPVVFAPLPIKDSSFDSDVYKPYTKGGTHVEFAVWPALLLYDKGPILAKGVAQGYENY